MPCGPVKISLKNDKIATQTMGETSRPLNGFITLRVADNSGSVVGGGGNGGGWRGCQYVPYVVLHVAKNKQVSTSTYQLGCRQWTKGVLCHQFQGTK